MKLQHLKVLLSVLALVLSGIACGQPPTPSPVSATSALLMQIITDTPETPTKTVGAGPSGAGPSTTPPPTWTPWPAVIQTATATACVTGCGTKGLP